MITKSDIYNVLKYLGAKPHYCGYTMLIDLIDIVYRSNGKKVRMTDLYYALANEYGKSKTSVDRALRSVIVDIDVTTDAYYAVTGVHKVLPTAAFIYSVVAYLHYDYDANKLNDMNTFHS